MLLRACGNGVQKYICTASTTGTKFSPPVPHVILLEGDRDEGDLVAIHFAGPTWQALDGSTVVGDISTVQIAPASDPDGVPWLRLNAKSNGGTGVLSRMAYIQQLYADGGKAPAGGCDQAHIQAEVLVEYSGQYFFTVLQLNNNSSAVKLTRAD